MGYAIELALDDEYAAKVYPLWDAIHTHFGGTDLRLLGARPHISLAVLPDLTPETFYAPLEEFASTCPVLDIHFASVASFPTAEGVVFLAPVVTEELLSLHKRFHQLLRLLNVTSNPYYEPGSWVPHCTIGQNLPAAKVASALDFARTAGVYSRARLVEISLIEFRPVRYCYRFNLT